MGPLLFVLLLSVKCLWAEDVCPHEVTLQHFSDMASKYTKSSVVEITSGVLLNVKVVDVEKIIVKGEGRLVFNRGHSITIKTKGILVQDNAELVIGSADCPHTDPVNIYLEGTRTQDRDTLGPEGDKFIMVTGNGSLQIVGQDKLAWTKLSGTVEKFDKQGSNVKFRHAISELADYKYDTIGLALSVFNSSMERTFYEVFNYMQSKVKGANKVIQRTLDALNVLQDGDFVTVTIHNKYKVKEGCNITDLYDKLEELSGISANQLALRGAGVYDAWAMVFDYTAGTSNQAFHRQIGTKLTRAVAAIDVQGYKVSAVSVVRYNDKSQSHADAIILDQSVGYPEITVLDEITSWNVGDEVLLTSTDFSWKHAEVRRIKEKIGTNKLKLNGELYYRHFGEIENRVDMRGEVALLTRNIKIQGVMSYECPDENGKFCDIGFDSYGGHIKVHESFGSVHLEGMELEFMGQTSDRGNYPVHFHMCKNITGKIAIVKRNSIHNTFRRAVTVHGTYGVSEEAPGVQVIENVAYDILGHAYFLEDGAEMATIFQKNLGASVKAVKNDFATDKGKVTVFWITNPKVIMVDNVAAGSEAVGIWYTFPREPVGMSEGLVYAFKEAKHTKLWRFDNNVVHSSAKNGMFFDNILDDEDGKVVGCMEYRPREDPLDPHSAPAKSQLTRLTAYKNVLVNTWLRGGYFEVIQYSSAESKKGMHIARGSDQQMFVRKSVFIGRSEGNSEEADYPDAITGESLGQYIGAVIHDGPTYYDSCWFHGFKPKNGSYVAAAIGFSTMNKFTSSVSSNLTNIRFGFTDKEGGNRLYDGKVDESVEGFAIFDSAETATIRDGDGSVTGCPVGTGPQWKFPSQVVVPEKYILTDRCSYRDSWNLAVCNDKYGKMKVMIKGVWDGTTMDFDKAGQMKRRSVNNSDDTAVEDRMKQKTTEYMMILGREDYYYEFQFTNDFPKDFRLTGRGVERDYGVVVGWCMPKNAVYLKDYTITTKDTNDRFKGDLKKVSSLNEVFADKEMDKYYIDGRFVYMKMHSNMARNEHWDAHDTDHCAGRSCPHIAIHMNTEMSFTPCFTATEDELSSESAKVSLLSHDCDLPATSPDNDWGAGDTLEQDQDGTIGEWSSWADCCYPEGETRMTSRYRVCDNPTLYGTGTDCTELLQESGTCQTPCPVDGVESEWGEWTNCFCDGIASGSSGMRTRERTCSGVANGGKACKGSFVDGKPCIGDCGYFPENW